MEGESYGILLLLFTSSFRKLTNGFYEKNKQFFPFQLSTLKELEDATPHVIIEPEMKPLLMTESGFNGANCSMDKIDIKDEPLQDESVSEFHN